MVSAQWQERARQGGRHLPRSVLPRVSARHLLGHARAHWLSFPLQQIAGRFVPHGGLMPHPMYAPYGTVPVYGGPESQPQLHRSASPTFREEDIQRLRDMFPSFDEDVRTVYCAWGACSSAHYSCCLIGPRIGACEQGGRRGRRYRTAFGIASLEDVHGHAIRTTSTNTSRLAAGDGRAAALRPHACSGASIAQALGTAASLASDLVPAPSMSALAPRGSSSPLETALSLPAAAAAPAFSWLSLPAEAAAPASSWLSLPAEAAAPASSWLSLPLPSGLPSPP